MIVDSKGLNANVNQRTFSFEFSTTACVCGIRTTKCLEVSWIGKPTRDGRLKLSVASSAINLEAEMNNIQY
jgi:hypothetical protein